jgi:hypothetical protein
MPYFGGPLGMSFDAARRLNFQWPFSRINRSSYRPLCAITGLLSAEGTTKDQCDHAVKKLF